ncbi:hypothetical protein [Tychonema sp. LEGE 07203]|nr:hypothetical protein [Tychonema sp. LEGE 07203]MBE9094048.1 hypothetical protein [Tychonema sp. LEGE 07203]
MPKNKKIAVCGDRANPHPLNLQNQAIEGIHLNFQLRSQLLPSTLASISY